MYWPCCSNSRAGSRSGSAAPATHGARRASQSSRPVNGRRSRRGQHAPPDPLQWQGRVLFELRIAVAVCMAWTACLQDASSIGCCRPRISIRKQDELRHVRVGWTLPSVPDSQGRVAIRTTRPAFAGLVVSHQERSLLMARNRLSACVVGWLFEVMAAMLPGSLLRDAAGSAAASHSSAVERPEQVRGIG